MSVALLLLVSTAQAQQARYYTPRYVASQVRVSQPTVPGLPGASTVNTFARGYAYGLSPEHFQSSSGPLAANIAVRDMITTHQTILPSQYINPMASPGSGGILSNNLSGRTVGSPGSTAQLPPLSGSGTTNTRYETETAAAGTDLRPVERTIMTPRDVTAKAAHTYLQTLVADATQQEPQAPKPIRSLATNEVGLLRNYMEAGEKAFERGIYTRAVRNFKLAREISLNSPESNLSLCHTYFAMGDVSSIEGTETEGQIPISYNQPTVYLIQATRAVPELAMLPLEPKEFWGQLKDYGDRLAELEQFCKENPEDAEALFLMGYFKWFDGDTNEAIRALSQAYPHASNEDAAEAIEAFWDGMKATGRVPEDVVLPPRDQGNPLQDLAPAEIPEDDEEDDPDAPAGPLSFDVPTTQDE
jgi:tetratricopeptide (TPR) repeat protein